MRTDPEKFSSELFDLAVVGGGINGAMVAWEASLRGLSVVLLERGDFAGGATGSGSRLIHAGFGRWSLGQIAYARAALLERQYWLYAAPHLVRPLGVLLLPDDRRDHLLQRARLALFDRMDPGSGLPRGRRAAPEEILKALPFAQERRGGALLCYEARVAFPERLVIAALQGATERGARVANYARVSGIQGCRDGFELRIRDLISNTAVTCRARTVINAAGAWASLLATPEKARPAPLQSIQTQLVTPQLNEHVGLATIRNGQPHYVTALSEACTGPWRTIRTTWRLKNRI